MPKKVNVEEPIVEKKMPTKRGSVKTKLPDPEPVDVEPVETSSDSGSEEEVEVAPKKKTKTKVAVKPKVEKRPPSLWMSVLQKNGFMVKGSAFKPTPKKGSNDYVMVRAMFDEEKAKLAESK